jgi:ABC-type branched-subunit amino acid transport system permease subunit
VYNLMLVGLTIMLFVILLPSGLAGLAARRPSRAAPRPAGPARPP